MAHGGSQYRSFSGTLIDPEKQRHYQDYDDEPPHLVPVTRSSPTTYHASPQYHQHITSRPPPTYAYHIPRRRFTRYFTLAITLVLTLFIWYLVRSSHESHRIMAEGLVEKPPPPPPAWEQFPFLKRYHGGIRTLVSRKENLREYPLDDDVELRRLQEAAMQQEELPDGRVQGDDGSLKRAITKGQRFDPYQPKALLSDSGAFTNISQHEPPTPCYLDADGKTEVPKLLAYNGVPSGFPDPVVGSYETLGLRDDVCFERYGRLGPYGYGYSRKYGGSGAGTEVEMDGANDVWEDDVGIDYRQVQWGEALDRCVKDNAYRFRPALRQSQQHTFGSMAHPGSTKSLAEEDESSLSKTTRTGKEFLPRTVVLLRTWSTYEYDAEDIIYLRALINELSIQSGAEYVVHFLIHVKDNDEQIWADPETYQRVLDDSLPSEFRGMGTLWSERQMALIYGGVPDSNYRDLPVHGVYRSIYMPVQYFAHMHPEFDFFWHWEMDVRYTGHFYHLFHQVSEWAKQQPRKGLWERNSRFYVPSEHGSWEDFRQMVRVQTEHGTASKQNIYSKLSADAAAANPNDNPEQPETPVWGPLPPSGEGDTTVDPENDPQSPHSYDKDSYEWGVGEDADFITFNPLFDPHHTNWILAEDVTGYNTTGGFPPRRTAIITASRLSARLLTTMHRETTLLRHTMSSEMWPGSCALQHGFKAVYAPHPVYIDRAWPTSYLAAVLNNGRNGATGGARTSVFSDERQHNLRGTTWYHDAGFAPNLWKRWLGYKVDNDGGEEWELANEGQICLPAMLLHPVKQVDMVYEHREGEV